MLTACIENPLTVYSLIDVCCLVSSLELLLESRTAQANPTAAAQVRVHAAGNNWAEGWAAAQHRAQARA